MIEITIAYLAEQGLSETFPNRFWSKVNKNGTIPKHRPNLGQCWLWTGSVNYYGQIGRRGHRTVCIGSHRASWLLHNGSIPDGLHVLHYCDNPICVNPAHLWLGTHLENVKDMNAKGRHGNNSHALKKAWIDGKMAAPPRLVGEQCPWSKLSASDVIRIRDLRHNGKPLRKLADQFCVSQALISKISNGEAWKHLL